MSTVKRRQAKKKEQAPSEEEEDVAAPSLVKGHSRRHSRSGRELERTKGKSKRVTDSRATISAHDSEENEEDDGGDDRDEADSRSSSRTRNTTQSVTVMVPVGETLSRIEESLDELKDMVAASSDSTSITASRTAGELKSAIRELRKNLGGGGDSSILINALRADTTVILELVRNLANHAATPACPSSAAPPVQLQTDALSQLTVAMERQKLAVETINETVGTRVREIQEAAHRIDRTEEEIKTRLANIERLVRRESGPDTQAYDSLRSVDSIKQSVDGLVTTGAEIREGVRNRARELQDVSHKIDKTGEDIKARLGAIERNLQDGASPSASEIEMLAGIRNVGAIKQNVERLSTEIVAAKNELKADIASSRAAPSSGGGPVLDEIKDRLNSVERLLRAEITPTNADVQIYDNLRDAGNVKQNLERLATATAEIKADLHRLGTTICTGGHSGDNQKTIEMRLVNIKDIVKEIRDELKNGAGRVTTVQVPVAPAGQQQQSQPLLVQASGSDTAKQVVEEIRPVLKDIRKGVMGLYKIPAGIKGEGGGGPAVNTAALDRSVADLNAAVASVRNVKSEQHIDLQPVLNATNTITGQLAGLGASIDHAKDTHRDLKESSKDIKEAVEQLKETVRKQCGKTPVGAAPADTPVYDDAAILRKLGSISASLEDKVDVKKIKDELDAIGALLRDVPVTSAEAIKQVAKTAEHVAQVADTQQTLMEDVKRLLSEQRQSAPPPQPQSDMLSPVPVQNSLVAATDSDPVSTAKLQDLSRRLEELVAQSAPAAGVTLLDAASREAITELITNAAKVVRAAPPPPTVTVNDIQTVRSASDALGKILDQRGPAASAPAEMVAMRTALDDVQRQVQALSTPQPDAAVPPITGIANDVTQLKNDLTAINNTLAVAVKTVSSSAEDYRAIAENIEKLQDAPVVELGEFMKTMQALIEQIKLAEGTFGDKQVQELTTALAQLDAKVRAQIAASQGVEYAVAHAEALDQLIGQLTEAVNAAKNNVAQTALDAVNNASAFDGGALTSEIRDSVDAIATSGARTVMRYIQNAEPSQDALKLITRTPEFANAAQALVNRGAAGAVQLISQAQPAITGETKLAIEAGVRDLASRNTLAIQEQYKQLLLDSGGPDRAGVKLLLDKFVDDASQLIADRVRDSASLLISGVDERPLAIAPAPATAPDTGFDKDDPYDLRKFREHKNMYEWHEDAQERWQYMVDDRMLRQAFLWPDRDDPLQKLSPWVPGDNTSRHGRTQTHHEYVSKFAAGCPVLSKEIALFVARFIRMPYCVTQVVRNQTTGNYNVDLDLLAKMDACMRDIGLALEKAYAGAHALRGDKRGNVSGESLTGDEDVTAPRQTRPSPRDLLDLPIDGAGRLLHEAYRAVRSNPALVEFSQRLYASSKVFNQARAHHNEGTEGLRTAMIQAFGGINKSELADNGRKVSKRAAFYLVRATFESDLWWSVISELDVATSRLLLRHMYRGCGPTSAALDTFRVAVNQIAPYIITERPPDKAFFMPIQFVPTVTAADIADEVTYSTKLSYAYMAIVSVCDDLTCRTGLPALMDLRLTTEEFDDEEGEFAAGRVELARSAASIAQEFSVSAPSEDSDIENSDWIAYAVELVVRGSAAFLVQEADNWSKLRDKQGFTDWSMGILKNNYGTAATEADNRRLPAKETYDTLVPRAAAAMALWCIAPAAFKHNHAIGNYTQSLFRPALLGSLRSSISGNINVDATELLDDSTVALRNSRKRPVLLDYALNRVWEMISVALWMYAYQVKEDRLRHDNPFDEDVRAQKAVLEAIERTIYSNNPSEAKELVKSNADSWLAQLQRTITVQSDETFLLANQYDLRGQIVYNMERALDSIVWKKAETRDGGTMDMEQADVQLVEDDEAETEALGVALIEPAPAGVDPNAKFERVEYNANLDGVEEDRDRRLSNMTLRELREGHAFCTKRSEQFNGMMKGLGWTCVMQTQDDPVALSTRVAEVVKKPWPPLYTLAFERTTVLVATLKHETLGELLHVVVHRIDSTSALPKYYRFMRVSRANSEKLAPEGEGAFATVSFSETARLSGARADVRNYAHDMALTFVGLHLDCSENIDLQNDLEVVAHPYRGMVFARQLGSMRVYQDEGQSRIADKLPDISAGRWVKVTARTRPNAPWGDQREKVLKDKRLWIVTRAMTKHNGRKVGSLVPGKAVDGALASAANLARLIKEATPQ